MKGCAVVLAVTLLASALIMTVGAMVDWMEEKMKDRKRK